MGCVPLALPVLPFAGRIDSASGTHQYTPDKAPQTPLLTLKLTGDWCGFRSSLQQEGIAYRGRVTQFGFGVAGGIQSPVAPAFAAQGIAGGDTFEYTGNSRHDFLIDLNKFGGLPHSKFVVTMENVRCDSFSYPQFSCLNKFSNESIPTMKRGVALIRSFRLIQRQTEFRASRTLCMCSRFRSSSFLPLARHGR